MNQEEAGKGLSLFQAVFRSRGLRKPWTVGIGSDLHHLTSVDLLVHTLTGAPGLPKSPVVPVRLWDIRVEEDLKSLHAPRVSGRWWTRSTCPSVVEDALLLERWHHVVSQLSRFFRTVYFRSAFLGTG